MNQSEFTLQVERLIESLTDMSKKLDYISVERKSIKQETRDFFNLMLSNITASELKAKTIYHIYLMLQIKKAALLKITKEPIIPGAQIRQFYSLLKEKNSNYSPEENKLSAFVNAANFIYSEPHKLQVLLTAFGMMSKHAASIEVILNTEASKLTEELINEKFNDYINYCILIYLIKIES
jgi:hypothetical protein